MASSPPPIMPDEIEEEENDDFGHLDDEDDDSSSYDLTGLSEKLRTIPQETILVAPKEVALPYCEQNGFPLETSEPEKDYPSLKIAEDIQKSSPHEICATFEAPTSGSEINGDEKETFSIAEHEQQSQSDLSESQVPIESVESVVSNFQKEITTPEKEAAVEDISANKAFLEDVGNDDFSTVEEDDGRDSDFPCDQLHATQECDKMPSPSDSPKSADNLCISKDDVDDFGGFEEASPELKPEDIPVTVPPLNLDDEEDDDFGDFASTTAPDEQPASFEGFASSSGWASLNSSTRGKIDQILIGLQLKLASVISNMFSNIASPDEDLGQLSSALDLTKEECDDMLWAQVHNVSTTPALNQKWKECVTRARLLTYLRIDPNNVVNHEPTGLSLKNPHTVSATAPTVPAFASGLGVTLQPVKSASPESSLTSHENSPSSSKPPLNQEFMAASGPLSLLPNEADYKGADTNKAESNSSDGPPPQNPNAQAILNSFPLLDFMQSPILSSRPTKL